MNSSYLAEYYRTIAQGRGTQQALTTTRPQALTPEILERYESAMSRGSGGTQATTTALTSSTPAVETGSATQPALTSSVAPALDPSAFRNFDITGEGNATGYSATDNTSGLTGGYGSVLGANIGQGMQSGMTTGAITGGLMGAIAGSMAGLPGILTGGIIGAGTSAFSHGVTGIVSGLAETLKGFFLGDLSMDDIFGYSTQLGISEGLQSQVSDSFNLDASTPEGFAGGYLGSSDAYGGDAGGGFGGGGFGGLGGSSGAEGGFGSSGGYGSGDSGGDGGGFF